jgi:hypothetical protein
MFSCRAQSCQLLLSLLDLGVCKEQEAIHGDDQILFDQKQFGALTKF